MVRMKKRRFSQTLQLKAVLCSHNKMKLMSSRPSRNLQEGSSIGIGLPSLRGPSSERRHVGAGNVREQPVSWLLISYGSLIGGRMIAEAGRAFSDRPTGGLVDKHLSVWRPG